MTIPTIPLAERAAHTATYRQWLAGWAVLCADALIAELEKTE